MCKSSRCTHSLVSGRAIIKAILHESLNFDFTAPNGTSSGAGLEYPTSVASLLPHNILHIVVEVKAVFPTRRRARWNSMAVDGARFVERWPCCRV